MSSSLYVKKINKKNVNKPIKCGVSVYTVHCPVLRSSAFRFECARLEYLTIFLSFKMNCRWSCHKTIIYIESNGAKWNWLLEPLQYVVRCWNQNNDTKPRSRIQVKGELLCEEKAQVKMKTSRSGWFVCKF